MQRVFNVSSGIFGRAALLALCFAAGARATTYNISSNTMSLTNDGTCGFREALDAINTGSARWGCAAPSGTNTINLSANTYTAPVALSILRSASIRCPAGTCVIDAGSINGDLFTIAGGFTPSVSMYRLTLRQSSSNTNFISGMNVTNGKASLELTVITGFRKHGFSTRNGDEQNLLNSTFSNNGKGIFLDNSGRATLVGNNISNNGIGLSLVNSSLATSARNTFTGNGTGVESSSSAFFDDDGSTISNSSGAGIHVGTGGQIWLAGSTIRGNKNRGLYMHYSSYGKVFNTTIDGNSTSGDGAGLCLLDNGMGGGAFAEFFQTTVSNNIAGGNGGGMFVAGTSNFINSTISSNTAARGGGVYNVTSSTNSYLNIIQSTVAFNQATVSGGGVVNVRGNGVDDVGLNQTIVARNSAPTHPDVSGRNKGVESLFGDLTGSQGDHSDDFAPANPLLGPLMDSPGPVKVKTHALLKGSPALDKYLSPSQYNTDGRGFPRPAIGKWDVGAYEEGPLETELLSVISTQGWHAPQDDAGLSNGKGTVLRSGAVGNYVTYTVAIPEAVAAGTRYKIEIGARTSPDGAIIELATSPGTAQFTRIGEVDLYSSTSKVAVLPPMTFDFTQPGIKHFRLKMTGRNPANTIGYFAFFDYIRISKQ